MKKMPLWSVVGFTFVSVAGTLLHFVYEWSGEPVLLAPFCAVNESIWEHMKLLYYPMLAFFFIEWRFRNGKTPAFFCSYLFGTLAGIVLIPILYYTYTGALGIFSDAVNIGIFFVSAAAAFFCIRYLESRLSGRFSSACVAFLILIGAVFAVFTFFPVKIPIFRDPVTGGYGIRI